MSFLQKIQKLPESQRKIILWSVIVILGLGLFTFYVKNVQKRLRGFETKELKEELQLPSLEEKLKGLPKFEMPKIEMPKIDEEKLKELGKVMKETKSPE